MTPLAVDMPELCLALEADPGDVRWFLDLRSGDVILVNDEYAPEEHDGVSVDDLESDTTSFCQVPAADPKDVVADMRAFVEQLADVQLKESLELALAAPKPERRFKAALQWLPTELERWHTFRQQRCQHRATAWLESLGIQAR
ncbi:MAG: hypothetical protein JNG84_00130 [Archangium sp.]|nr:hypothetical protein [Archangium sp.]